jgi:DNA-binding FadR family transcriptional regulator
MASARKKVDAATATGATARTNPRHLAEDPVRVRKTGELVAERLRKQIARGTLPIGHQLPREEELTAAFGIARTTLREALRVLESQGLIEIKRGRGGGGIVTMPSLDHLSEALAVILQLQQTTIGDLDEARLMIEPPLAGRLARHHTEDDLKALVASVDDAADAADDADTRAFGLAAARLHEAIVERGGNTTMTVLGGLLHDVVRQHLRASAGTVTQDVMHRAVRSYRKLIRLIEAGDAEAAEAHWRRQLSYLWERRGAVGLLDVYDD